MKISTLISFILIILLYLFASEPAIASSDANAGTSVTIDPAQKGPVIEGWGASLCWWANIMGGFPDSKVKTICDWITDPVNGLNMNVFRFNIGGGDDPSHNHMRSDGGNMPGYKASDTLAFDWTQDANQRKILAQLIESRISKAGINDIQIIGFSNSPPYWMTKSGCSAGNADGNVCNLKSEMFDDFADYLTEVVRYYHDSLGITFNYIEPFNEPETNWWKELGGQEGCHFSNSEQASMIRELYASLQKKEMLSYCHITANDANSIDNAYSSLLVYKAIAADVLPMLDMVSVHSYGGNNRQLLGDWAQNNGKKLWQSESGPLYVGDSYESQVMIMADRIITDFRDLKCSAWCDWQLGGSGTSPDNAWALFISDYTDNLHPVTRNTNFYMRAQFSRYLKTGYTIIKSSEENSLAALSPNQKELVLVISNSETTSRSYTIDLSNFSGFGKVTQYRTRAQESLGIKNSKDLLTISGSSFDYNQQPQSVVTFIIPINQTTTNSSFDAKKNGSIYYSNGNLYTNFPGASSVSISIYSSTGKLVKPKSKIPAKGVTQISLAKGMYLINTNINKAVQTNKIAVLE